MKFFITLLFILIGNQLYALEISWIKLQGAPKSFAKAKIINDEIILLENSILNENSYIYFSNNFGESWKEFELPAKANLFELMNSNEVVIPLYNGKNSKGFAYINKSRDSITYDSFLSRLCNSNLSYLGDNLFIASEYNKYNYFIDFSDKKENLISIRKNENRNLFYVNTSYYDKISKTIYLIYIDDVVFTSQDKGKNWDSISTVSEFKEDFGIFHNGEDLFFTRLISEDNKNMYLVRYKNDFQEQDTVFGPKANHDPYGFPLSDLQVASVNDNLLLSLYKQELFHSTNSGATFVPINKPIKYGKIHQIYINKNNQIILNIDFNLYYGEINPTSIHKILNNKSNIYPNPVASGEKIWVQNQHSENIQRLIILNLNNQVVMKINNDKIFFKNDGFGFSTRNLISGVYFLRINNQNKMIKFIVK